MQGEVMQNANNSLMVPVYTGYDAGGKKSSGGKSKKGRKTQYDEQTKRLLREMGMDPEEEDMFLLGGGMPMYGPGGLEGGLASMPVYNMPSMTGGRRGYNPAMQPKAAPMQQSYPGDGNTSMIDIRYTASDGTTYQMGVMTPQENRGKALYNVLCGLYGLMMAEGKSGQYKGGGKSYGSGRSSSYAGGKGGK